MITLYNDYTLDPNYEEDKTRSKKIEIDYTNRKQLFDIIKRRGQYKNWQPSRDTKRKLIRGLEDLDIKEEKNEKSKRIYRAEMAEMTRRKNA